MKILIGLDIGTTGCKAIAFDEQGQVMGGAMREYKVDFPQPTWAEQDAENVWKLSREVLTQVFRSLPVDAEVLAIGLSVQGEAVFPVDEKGYALHPAILGMDTRTGEQNKWLADKFGPRQLFEHTGMPVHTVNTMPKMLWFKENEPHIWKNAARFVLYEDFLVGKLTGSPVISHCLASRTAMYDIHTHTWSALMLAALELDEKKMSPIRESGFVCGEMKKDLAEKLGLRNRPLVVSGGHDQACGALGAGNVAPGQASVSTGTAEVVEVTMAAPVLNETLFRANISIYSHVVPGRYVAMTLNHSGGMLLRWFRDTFCQSEISTAQLVAKDAYDLMLDGASANPTGLYVLPHFAGSGTPTFDTASKGAFLGMTFATGKADIAKAILEGITFELRVNLDLLRSAGVTIDSLRAIGGGAKSDMWLQLKADIAGIPVLRPRVTEAAAWGAAVLAGHGAGIFADIAAAADQHVVLEKRFNPDPRQMERYQDSFEIYTQIYPVLAPLLHQMQ